MCFTPGVLTCVFDEGSLSGEVADLEGLAVKDKQFVADYKLMAVVGGGTKRSAWIKAATALSLCLCPTFGTSL